MNQRNKILFSLLLSGLFFATPIAKAQYIVGNAGDGIIKSGRVFLRDLYERDLGGKTKYVVAIDPRVAQELQNYTALPLSPLEMDLLQQKLSLLEKTSACFGQILAKALKAYTWVFEEQALALLPEIEVIRHYPAEERVQIANRYLSSVHVHQPSWLAMDSEHRVALILHEILLSLSPPKLPLNIPPQGLVREMVGKLFSDVRPSDEILRSMMFQMTEWNPDLYCPRAHQIMIKAEDMRGSRRFSYALQSESVAAFLQKSCARLVNSKTSKTFYLVWYKINSIELKLSPYLANSGGQDFFLRLASQESVKAFDRTYYIEDFYGDERACVSELMANKP